MILCWSLAIVLGFVTHACTMDPAVGQKSTAAVLVRLVISIGGVDYTANISGTSAFISGVTPVPASVTVKTITVSDKATSNVQANSTLALTSGSAKIAVTAEDGITKKEYTLTVSETNVVSVLQEKSSLISEKIATANTEIQKASGFAKVTSSIAMGQGGFQPYSAPSVSKMTASSLRKVFATSTAFDDNRGKVFKLTATKAGADAMATDKKLIYPETGSGFFTDVTLSQSPLVDASAITLILPANYFTEISKYTYSASSTVSPEYSYVTSSAYTENYTDFIIVVLRKLMYLERPATDGDVADAKSLVKEKDDAQTDSETEPLLLFDADLKNSDKTLLLSIQSMMIYRKIESTDKTFAKSIIHVISVDAYKLILSSSNDLQYLIESADPTSISGEFTFSDLVNVYKLKSGSSHTSDHPIYDSIYTSEIFSKTKIRTDRSTISTVRLESRFGGSDIIIKGNIVNQLKADGSEISQDLKLELDAKKSDGKRSKSTVNRIAKAHDPTGDFDFTDETTGTTKKLSEYLDMTKVTELTETVKKLSGAVSLKVHFEKIANYLIP